MDTADAADRVSGTNLSDPLPTGTVTILFTDVEGSTRLWEMNPTAMKESLARHNAILHEAVRSHRGQIVKEMGDGMLAVFPTAHDALAAAAEAQANLASTAWGDLGPLQVRMSLHTGEPEIRGGDYFGPVLNRAARLMAAANGGQVIVSKVTEGILRDALPEGFDLIDLGEHRLRDLSRPERVFQLTGPGLASRFPQLHSLDALRGNLPTELSSFIGREREVATVTKALAEVRLVTLTGVGGVGKTRLALQVAGEVLPDFPDGAWLCELAPVRDAAAVGGSVASIFGIKAPHGSEPAAELTEFLRPKHLLLVLDNCEHLLDGVANMVRMLQSRCPNLTILAASREGLGLEVERVIAVSPLSTPASGAGLALVAQSDAARLFVVRAVAVRAGFELNAENAASVAEVCRRLDGIPLALELAAARLVALSPAELVRRLDQRFQLLAGGRRGMVERHQTLRAAIDWSYGLLTQEEQHLLDRLSVFAGGWTMASAEAVTTGGRILRAAVLDHLTSLVSKSLVIAVDQGAGETRFRSLETIREYAEERLLQQGTIADVRSRHSRYFADWIEAASGGLRGADEATWVRRLAQEQENVRVALAWAIESDDCDAALRILAAAKPIPINDLPVTAAVGVMAEAALELTGARDHPRFGDALLLAADYAWSRHDYGRADQLCDQADDAERRLGKRPDAYILGQRGGTALSAGRIDEAKDLWARALAISQANAQMIEVAYGEGILASLRWRDGDTTAVADAEEALRIARESRHPSTIGDCAYRLGSMLVDTEPDRAQSLLRESIELSESIGVPQPSAYAALALIALGKGADEEAMRQVARAIDLIPWFQGRFVFGYIRHAIARTLASQAPEAAAVLLGAGSVIDAGDGKLKQIVHFRDETIEVVKASLGDARFRELHGLGASMDNEQAYSYARTQINAVLDGAA